VEVDPVIDVAPPLPAVKVYPVPVPVPAFPVLIVRVSPPVTEKTLSDI
jgi:hypothetical protein